MTNYVIAKEDRPTAIHRYFDQVRLLVPRDDPALVRELQLQATCALFAGIEGLLKIDYFKRIDRPATDALDSRMKLLFKRCQAEGKRVPAFRDLLEEWRVNSGKGELIGRLKQFYGLRNWISHGRYFKEKSGATADFDRLLELAILLARNVPGWPKLI